MNLPSGLIGGLDSESNAASGSVLRLRGPAESVAEMHHGQRGREKAADKPEQRRKEPDALVHDTLTIEQGLVTRPLGGCGSLASFGQ